MRAYPPTLAAALLLCALPATATTFTVTTTSDSADGACDSHCSLREAIIAANASAGSDTINVPEGVFTLTLAGADEDACLTGDLDITDDVTISGLGADRTVIRGSGDDRVLNVVHGTVQIVDLTVSGGDNVQLGGGVYAYGGTYLHLAHVAFIDNHATIQGGAAFGSAGMLVADCLFAANRSDQFAGALSWDGPVEIVRSTFVANNAALVGGALYAWGTVEDSLFVANSANSGSAVFVPKSSGTLTNVTFSANVGLASGPAVQADAATVTLQACTFAAATPRSVGTSSGANISLDNTVIAATGLGLECQGTGLASAGHNLDAGDTCGLTDPTDLAGVDPGLRPLRDNGGATYTHALLGGSPAVDAGGGATPTADQRGTARPQGAAPDIGAYEADGSEPPMGLPLTVPVIAHVAGVGGTPWRSDLAATNPTGADLDLVLRYTPSASATVAETVSLDPHATVLLGDLVATLFLQGDGRGTLEIVPPASGPVPAVVSRTYAVADGKRLGQGMPALDLLPPATYYVPGLREDDAYRSNIGVAAGEEDLTVQVDLFRGSDGAVGSTFARTVTAHTQQQWRLPDMFPGLAQAGVPMTARVRIFGEAAPYGSLVDQASSDAVTLLAQGTGPVWTIPVVAHNPGGGGTFWRSDLYLHNPKPVEALVELEYLAENTDNGAGGLTATPLVVPPRGTVTVADVAGTLFGIANGKGALNLVASPSIVVSSRTYTTREEGGTYGLGVPAVLPNAFDGTARVVTGIRVGDGYRTNLGVAGGSPASAASSLTLTLRGADGSVLATRNLTLENRSLVQTSVQDLFAIDWSGFTVGSVEAAAARFPFLVYVSVVDGTSQDPIYAVAGGRP